MFPSGVPELDGLLGGGYPDRSVVLVMGDTGTNKERLGLRFVDAGLSLGDFCIYVTRLSVHDARLEATASGILRERSPFWIASEGGDINLDMNDFANLSFNIKNLLKGNGDRRIRIVLDSLSPLLLLSHPETVHKFLSQLFSDVKQYAAVLLGIIDQGMHDSQVLAAMEDLFDGVISLSPVRAETGESPRISVRKMRGVRFPQGGSAGLLSTRGTGPSDRVTPARRLAVLPMANFSPDPEDEYFSDGMTEELISVISKVSGLDVISRTSSMKFKGAKKTIAEVSNELKVGTILEGSVRKTGSRVRITVKLLNASEDRHLWTQSYDRELQDIFAMQSDVATRVAEALKVRLLDREAIQIHKTPTENTEAYVLYLKGKHFWNRMSKDSMGKAIECFQQAIEQDHGLALAYVGIADCYNMLTDYAFLPSNVAYPKAVEAAKKALELDDTLAEAHSSYAVTLTNPGWDWSSAESEHKRALDLNPNYSTAHQWYSLYLRFTRRFKEALGEAKQALELDPLSAIVNAQMGDRFYVMKEYDLAIEFCRRALALEPNFHPAVYVLIQAYVEKGMYDEAMDEQRRMESTPGHRNIRFAWIYARSGRREEAGKILDDSLQKLGDEYVAPIEVAVAYLALGQNAKALEWLNRGYELRDAGMPYYMSDPPFENLRSDPMFISLLRKMDLE